MGTILREVPEWPVIAYHDNVYVFGHSQQEVTSRVQTVRSVAQNCALGALEFGQPRPWTISEPFDFLGRAVDDPSCFPWKMRPNDAVLDRYAEACDDMTLTVKELEKIVAGLERFKQTYDGWEDGDEWTLMRRAELSSRLYFLSGTLGDRQSAVEAVTKVLLLNDCLTTVDTLPSVSSSAHHVRKLSLANAVERRVLNALAVPGLPRSPFN